MEIRLSSYKRGHGLKELLSEDVQSYWATDHILPHGIQIKFDKLTYVEEVRMYFNFSTDDSYTPKEIKIRTGLVESEIETVTNLSLTDPEGLFSFLVKKKCFYLQIIIVSNHQDGKDSHVRHLKLMESSDKEMFIELKNIHNLSL